MLRSLEPAHVRYGCDGVAAQGDQLGGDRDRDLFGRDGADIESDRGVNPVEKMGWQAFLSETLENFDDFALGPDHADIARASFEGPAQDTHIVAVAARDDDEVGGFVRVELLHRLVEIERMHFTGSGKTFFEIGRAHV